MAKATPWGAAFNGGELSPRLRGRIDIDKYVIGCETMDNFLPTVQGPVIKRSGFRFVRSIKDVTQHAVLVPFEFSTTQAYVLEFGDLYMRVYKDNGQVLDDAINVSAVANTTPVGITTAASHGYATGDEVFLTNTGKASLDNRYWVITVTGGTTFTLDGSTAAGAGVVGTSSRVFELVTPYTSADLELLAWAQSADVLYLANPAHAPQKISRTDHNVWTITEIDFNWFPFAPENEDEDDAIAASDDVGSVTLTSVNGLFTSDMVGTYIRLREIPEANHPEWKENTTYPAADYGAFVSAGSIAIGDQVQFEGRVYELATKFGTTAGDGFVPPIHEDGIKSDGRYDWKFVNYGAGYARITAVTSAYRATATVIKQLPLSVISPDMSLTSMTGQLLNTLVNDTAHGLDVGDKVFIFGVVGTIANTVNNKKWTVETVPGANSYTINAGGTLGLSGTGGTAVQYRWDGTNTGTSDIYPTLWMFSFGAWSESRGYPRAVTFSEDRLLWAGTDSDPQTIWWSRSGRYEDHRTTQEDDSAMVTTLNSSTVNVIAWMQEQGVLRIGTVGGEWSPSKSDEPLTPGNVAARLKQRSSYGSREGVIPATVEDVVLFAQRAGRKLLELVPDSEIDGASQYPDLTILAEHVSTGIIKEFAYQGEPDRILWTVMENGELWGLTYNRAQQVGAWHRVTIGGTGAAVESFAVIPTPDGTGKQLWAIIQRIIDGTPQRYVEILDPTWMRGTPIADAFYVDSGLTYSGTAATVIGGLDHLEGEEVVVNAAGIAVGPLTVTSGEITLPSAVTKAQVGLAYSAGLVPSKLEAGGADGPAQGKIKRVTTVVLRVDETGRGLFIGPTLARASTEVVAMELAQEMRAGRLFSGDSRPQPWPGGYEQGGRIAVRHTTPLPCTLLAIGPKVTVQDG